MTVITFNDIVENIDTVVIWPESEIKHLPLESDIRKEYTEKYAQGVHDGRQRWVSLECLVTDVCENLDEGEDNVQEGGHTEEQKQDHKGSHVRLEEIGPAVAVEGPTEAGEEEDKHEVADGWPLGCDGHVGCGVCAPHGTDQSNDDYEEADVVEADCIVEYVVGCPVGNLVRAR